MIVTFVFIALFVFAAGMFNGRMDIIKEYQLDKDDWKNKWKWFPVFKDEIGWTKARDPYKKKWYYFGIFEPEFVERFPFSSTILVFLTDEWHGKKFNMFLCYELVIMLLVIHYDGLPWWTLPIGIIAIKAIRGIGFNLKHKIK